MAIGDKVYIADKPTLDVVNAKTGTTTDTGGTTTAGGIFAKLNAILQQFMSNWTDARAAKIDTISSGVINLSNRGVVKSVQRGIGIGDGSGSGSQEQTISISPVNPSKTVVILNTFNSNVQADANVYLLSLSSNNFSYITGVRTEKVSYQVIEFY